MNQLATTNSPFVISALVVAACDRASVRSLEFFAGQIRNPESRLPVRARRLNLFVFCERPVF
jgi:hypothetical protein